MDTNLLQKSSKRKAGLLFLFITLTILHLEAQSWQWGNAGGASDNVNPPGPEKVTSMCTSADGSTYMTAQIGRINLKVAGNLKETYSTVGLNDWVIAGFACNGDYKWSKVIGGYSGTQLAYVSVDGDGNVYAAITIRRNPSNVSPAPHFDSDLVLGASANNVNTYKETIYLIKYDSNGNYLWSRTPQAANIDRATAVQSGVLGAQVDAQGNSYLLCLLAPSTYSNGQYVVSTKGFHIVKYDKDGNFISAFPLDMNADTGPFNLKMIRDHNNGRFYLAGEYTAGAPNGLRFGGQLVVNGKYLAAFDSTGNLLWERENAITTNWGDGGISYGVAVDLDSNVYFIGATGYQAGNPDLIDSFNGVPFIDNGGISPWPFIVKLDSEGNSIWQTNGSYSSLEGVVVNGDEVAVTCGASDMLWQNVHFDPPASGQPYLARFRKSDGEIINIHGLTTGGNDAGTIVTTDAHGNYYVGGRFGGTLTAGASTVTYNGGSSDFFVAKFGTDNCDLATQDFHDDKLKIYPNPVQDWLYIDEVESGTYKIYNNLGLEILSGTTTNQGINMERIPAGVYMLQVQEGSKLKMAKVIKL
jgi:hypothetical protein